MALAALSTSPTDASGMEGEDMEVSQALY